MPYADPVIRKQRAAERYLRSRERVMAKSKQRYLEKREDILAKCKERYLKIRHTLLVPPDKRQKAGPKAGNIPWNKGVRGKYSSWNKGKTFSDETKLKLRLSHLGKIPPNKGKPSKRAKELHHNWRGGVTPVNEIIRKSTRYKEWRNAVFKRDEYTCVQCGEVGLINADHIKPFCAFPELRFDVSNGRTLCVKCHKLTDTYGYKAMKFITRI